MLPLLPWLLKNFLTLHCSIKQALAGSTSQLWTRGTSVLPQQTTKQPCFGCVQSLTGCAYFNLAGLSVCVSVASSQWQYSPANLWSAEFTHHVLEMVRFTWNLSRGGTAKKYQVSGTVPSRKPPKCEPYRTLPCRTMQWKSTISVFWTKTLIISV